MKLCPNRLGSLKWQPCSTPKWRLSNRLSSSVWSRSRTCKRLQSRRKREWRTSSHLSRKFKRISPCSKSKTKTTMRQRIILQWTRQSWILTHTTRCCRSSEARFSSRCDRSAPTTSKSAKTPSLKISLTSSTRCRNWPKEFDSNWEKQRPGFKKP